jgi:hypothetical protein
MEPKDYKETNPRASFYACLLPELRQIAIDHGYTLAIHGSMARDLDLIAVPWAEQVQDHEIMVDKMLQAIGGTIFGAMLPQPGDKPHGRIVYTLSILGDWFIDLSVIPKGPTHPAYIGVTMNNLLWHLAKYGGQIISTKDLQPHWIDQARASNRLYVDNQSLGYVWEPNFKNGLPETPEEVEQFEKWYPLETPLPKELNDTSFLFKKRINPRDN